jgi:hypothetical protein
LMFSVAMAVCLSGSHPLLPPYAVPERRSPPLRPRVMPDMLLSNGPCRNYARHGRKPSTGGTNCGISAPIKGASFEGTTAHEVHAV